MNCHKNALSNTEEGQSIRDVYGCEIRGRLAGHGRTGTASRHGRDDEEEKSFVRLELPLVITGWVVFLIILGYFVYG